MANKSKIYIKPSKRGTFTKAAKKRGMGTKEFATKVLANKSNYSSAMVKKANFARNASKWNKEEGGVIPKYFVGGAVAGASAGMALGPIGAVAGGLLGGAAELIGNNKKKKAEEEALRQQRTAQRMEGAYNEKMSNLQPQAQYAPTFQRGGRIKLNETLNPATKAYAKHEAYKQPIDSAFAANFPEAKELLMNAPSNRKDRMQYADSVALKRDDYLKDLTKYVTPEQIDKFKSSRKELENITGVNLKGTGEEADAFGWRNYLFPSGAIKERKYNGETKAKYKVIYDPDTDSYFREDIEFKKGGKINSMKKYQMGGMSGMPNAELEGGESIELPNGMGAEVEGPSHAQGGVDMNLPEGTEIYSDKLKVPGTKETFSEANKKILNKLKKYEKTLDNPKATSLATRTAQKMISKLEQEQDQLFQLQQSLNGNSTGQQPGQPKFELGGEFDIPIENWMLDPTGFQSGPKSIQNMPQAAPNTSTLSPMSLKDTSGMKEPKAGILGQMSAAAGGMEGGTLSSIATVAPALYNIGRGIFDNPKEFNARDFYNPYEASALNRMKNRSINVNPMLEANRNAAQTARYNVRNTARTRGELLGSYAPISAARSRADASVYSQKQQAENQYAGETAQMEAQLGQQRAATDLQISDMNERNRASRRNMLGTGLSQLSQYAQVNRQRQGLEEMDEVRVAALKQMFPEVWEKLISLNGTK